LYRAQKASAASVDFRRQVTSRPPGSSKKQGAKLGQRLLAAISITRNEGHGPRKLRSITQRVIPDDAPHRHRPEDDAITSGYSTPDHKALGLMKRNHHVVHRLKAVDALLAHVRRRPFNILKWMPALVGNPRHQANRRIISREDITPEGPFGCLPRWILRASGRGNSCRLPLWMSNRWQIGRPRRL
jgi:hypothetical protein